MAVSDADPHPLLRFRREDGADRATVEVDPDQTGPIVGPYFLGNFFEHLSFATLGGVSAELLSNPTFSRQANLTPSQVQMFIENARSLVDLYLSGGDPILLRPRWLATGGDPSEIRPHWVSTPLSTGFSVAILDDVRAHGLPLAWAPLGYPDAVSPSVGRVGGGVRLRGGQWPQDPERHWTDMTDGPAGIRQGVFLPTGRCLAYDASTWLRIADVDSGTRGQVEVGFRRRIATPDGSRHAGEILASQRLEIDGVEWQRVRFRLELPPESVAHGEPIDLYLRWIPRPDRAADLLLDRLSLEPADALEGLDPEVIRVVRGSTLPRLRWPGGNFVNHYHWRDGIGPVDDRPTYPNEAWGGLEYNLIGTDEFLAFCRQIGAEPHIAVNSGTAPAEEAAAWVEYCNGSASTPMGALRAANGHREPYDVRIWEVGNENYGFWQGGYVGSDENARRFGAFARAMRAASPTPIELLACGNNFDFAVPGPGYDHVTADGHWHDRLLQTAADEIDYISLHALPVNDHLLEALNDEQAHEAVLAQVTTWERRFLPDLLRRCDAAGPRDGRPPIRLAITEWGPLGGHPNRLMVENFGGVVYAGTFLNFMIRNSERIPMASPNGFMHGGSFRKVFGDVFMDPLVQAMQLYTPFIGATPVACLVTSPGYDVPVPADLGAVDADIPYVDAVVCRPADGDGWLAAVANRHLSRPMEVTIRIPGADLARDAVVDILTAPEVTARATPAEQERFPVERSRVPTGDGALTVVVPPFSVAWIRT
jgi:alpha-N-arabinofuranosidase